MNYTGGDTCHKVYRRSTTIFFYCDHSTQKVSARSLGMSAAVGTAAPRRSHLHRATLLSPPVLLDLV